MSASAVARKTLSSFLLPTATVGMGYASQCTTEWSDRNTSTKCDGARTATATNGTKSTTSNINSNSIGRNSNIQKRMTAIGHFSLKTETASNPSVPTFFLALSNTKPDILNPSKSTLTPNDFEKAWLKQSMPDKHPRFHQKVSSTVDGYFEEKGVDELHHHITETVHPMVYRQDLKRRIESLVSSAMDVRDKLWEVQISSGELGQSGAISKRNVVEIEQSAGKGAADTGTSTGGTKSKETILLFKCHHSLGDAVSLVAALGDLLDEAEEIKEKIQKEIARRRKLKKKKGGGGMLSKMLKFIQRLIWFLLGSIRALVRQGYLILTTRTNPFLAVLSLTKEEGLELSKLGRSVSWCDVASVDEVKRIAKILGGPKATVNDVFVSCVSAAIARQLEEHRQTVAVRKGSDHVGRKTKQHHINVVIPSHLAGGILPPGRGVGNFIGAFVAQVPGEMDDSFPSKRLSLVHDELYKVKRSPAAILSYLMAKGVAKYFPERLAIRLFESSSANAAVAITNSRGFEDKVHINGMTVEAVAGFLPLPPGLPVGVVVGSYGSVIHLSVNADKWAVPDADIFLSWVLDEYKLLCKEAALKA